MEKIIIYTDGGSRGNPGPAAIGLVADLRGPDADSHGIKEYSKLIGQATNNEAEYQAVIFALKKVKQLIGKEKCGKTEIEIRSDSELLVNQLNGKYKIKEEGLIPFFIEIWNLKQDFGGVKFVQIPREENRRADALLNHELNSRAGLF
jgi:ribonuclease HI